MVAFEEPGGIGAQCQYLRERLVRELLYRPSLPSSWVFPRIFDFHAFLSQDSSFSYFVKLVIWIFRDPGTETDTRVLYFGSSQIQPGFVNHDNLLSPCC